MSTIEQFEPTHRFSNRVAEYLRYRPRYPDSLVEAMRDELGLRSEHVIADVGSGTGFLTELLLANGNVVFGVEPNREMREAGEEFLARFERYHSIDGTAEATTLADGTIDVITAAQAFHWFDPVAARREFARILKPHGLVALVWNNRHVDTTPFLRAYEDLLQRYGTDYGQVCHRAVSEGDEEHIAGFFAPSTYRKRVVGLNVQAFDYQGLEGRLLSASYAPRPGHERYDAMIADLHEIFDEHNVNGEVELLYDTELFSGTLDGNHLQ